MYRHVNANSNGNFNEGQIQLINTFRKLWEQHVMWTRSFIISNVTNQPDLDAITKRLLRNPVDFANELRPYYGNAKADEFKNLFQDHLLIAAKLVNDAKAGKSNDVVEDRKKWQENAVQIANFLSELNPDWNAQDWQRALLNHLKMTEDEAILRLNGEYTGDIINYDRIEAQALNMADLMSYGIIRQFKI